MPNRHKSATKDTFVRWIVISSQFSSQNDWTEVQLDWTAVQWTGMEFTWTGRRSMWTGLTPNWTEGLDYMEQTELSMDWKVVHMNWKEVPLQDGIYSQDGEEPSLEKIPNYEIRIENSGILSENHFFQSENR